MRSSASWSLQCGHGNDAVENGQGHGLFVSWVQLQCGHGNDAVENIARVKEEGLTCTGFNAATAMTPGRTSREGRGAASGARLQWGHGNDAGENILAGEAAAAPRLASMRPRQ